MPQSLPTILIVDDNHEISHMLTLLLKRFGFHVLVAEDGETGCALAERENPTLVICDERMPRLDGFGTLLRLKSQANTRHIPVVMMGGSDLNGERDWAKCGASSFIPKPFQITELVKVVQKIVRPK